MKTSARVLSILLLAFVCFGLQITLNSILGFLHYHYTHVRLIPFIYLGSALGPALLLLENRFGRPGWVFRASPWVVSSSLLLILIANQPFSTSLALILVFGFSYGALLHAVLTNFRSWHYVADLLGGLAGLLFAFFTLELLGAEAQLLLLITVLVGVVGMSIRHNKLQLLCYTLYGFFLIVAGAHLKASSRLDLLAMSTPGESSHFVEFPLAADAVSEKGARVLASRWSTVARVDALYYPESKSSLLHYNNRPFSMLSPSSSRQITILEELIGAAKTALVIGVGGGGDIDGLLQLGVPQITGVEVNSATIALMKNELHSLSDQLYSRAEIILAEGRAYVERNRGRKKFDIIVLKGTDLYVPQWQSHIFLESYLYTKEALSSYWNLLSEDGKLIIIRAFFPSINRSIESVRLMKTHREFVEENGMNLREHVLVFTHGFGGNSKIPKRSVFVLSKSPLVDRQLAKIEKLPKFFSTLSVPADVNSVWPSELCLADIFLKRSSSCNGAPVASTSDNYPFFSALSQKDVLMWSVLDPSSLLFLLLALVSILIYSLSSWRFEIQFDGLLKTKALCLFLGLVSGFLYPFYYHNLLLFSPSPNHTFLIIQFGTVAGYVLGVGLAKILSIRLFNALMLITVGLLLLVEFGRTTIFHSFGDDSLRLLLTHFLMISFISAVTGSIFPRCLWWQEAFLFEDMRLRLFGLNLAGLGIGVISAHFICILFGLRASFFVVLTLLVLVTLIVFRQGGSREIKPA